MPKRPELLIYHDADDFPIAATCSVCKEEMPTVDRGIVTSQGAIGWFSAMFSIHVQRCHPEGADSQST